MSSTVLTDLVAFLGLAYSNTGYHSFWGQGRKRVLHI